MPYQPSRAVLLKSLRSPVRPWSRRNRSHLIVTAVSNCDDFAGRAPMLSYLRQRLNSRFVNFGNCENTASLPRERNHKEERLMAKFAGSSFFYLALENSVCEDYITEKLWRAVRAGAVPVVFDAPQRLFGGADTSDAPLIPGYRRVLPPGSYVNIANFSSADALMEHLEAVARDPIAYNACGSHCTMPEALALFSCAVLDFLVCYVHVLRTTH